MMAVICVLLLARPVLLAQDLDASAPPAMTAGGTLQTVSELERYKKLDLADLMKVEVTSVSRQESSVGQSPAAITVITPEMIRRSGATTFPEILRMVPGMDVARIDNNKWAVGVRGFNTRFQEKLLVQVDGRTVYNPLFAGVYWDTVDYPLEDVERIEVIRGPGASVWGANAVNGIINIITKPADQTLGGLLSLGGGSAEQAAGTFRYGLKIGDDVNVRIYGKSFTRTNTYSEAGDPKDDWWGASGGLRLDWQASPDDVLTVDAGYLHGDSGRKDIRAQQRAPFFFINEESEVSNGAHILGRWTHTIREDASWTLQAFWDTFRRKSANTLDIRFDTYDVDFQHNFRWGSRQKIVWGLGYRLVESRLGPSGRDDGFNLSWHPERASLNLFSTFVQDEFVLVEDRLSLTLGSKLEHNDFTGWEVQPTARVLWTPTKTQTFWASFSRAVRTPSFADDSVLLRFPGVRSAAGTVVFPALAGNKDFKSETELAYEIGFRTQATEKLSVDVAAFYNEYDNISVAVPLPQEGALIRVQRQNSMSGTTYGAEVTATWQVTDTWRLYGAYSFLQMQLQADERLTRANKKSAEAAEGRSPAHQVYLSSSWDLPHDFEFDLIGRFVDRLQGFNQGTASSVFPDEIDAYFSLDARLAWRPTKHLELSIVGQNLLDSHHPEFGTDVTLKTALVQMRRGVYAQVTWRF